MSNLSFTSTLFFRAVALTAMLLPTSTHAQNWQPVYFSETANYSLEVEADEVFLYLYPFAEGQETNTGRFLPHLNSRDLCTSGGETWCSSMDSCEVAGSAFLQEFAVFMPGGVVEFQNPDTFRIHCYAQLGEGWTFKTDNDGNEVWAEVTDHFEGTVLGQTDSIKVITAEDGTVIHLSKHHGIINWMDAESNFVLNSIPARDLGASNLSNAKVFDFNPGDVFVYLHLHLQGEMDIVTYNEQTTRGIVRHEVTSSTSTQDSLLIQLLTTSYISSLHNWTGSATSSAYASSVVTHLNVPVANDCAIYTLPVGGAMPARIPAEIDAVLVKLLSMAYTCNSGLNFTEDCTEASLYPTSTFTKLTAAPFGNHSVLSTNMNLYGGPLLDANSSASEVLLQDPREFYGWEWLLRCDFQYQQSSNFIEVGETLYPVASDLEIPETHLYALGEGLGLVAYDFDYYGLGGYCSDRMVLVGYQKLGEEAHGFVPAAIEITTLSSKEVLAAAPLHIYPNPASTTVHLDLPGGTLIRATLHDMQGRQVLEAQLTQSESVLDVSPLPKGMYLIRVEGRNGVVYSRKLALD